MVWLEKWLKKQICSTPSDLSQIGTLMYCTAQTLMYCTDQMIMLIALSVYFMNALQAFYAAANYM